jgi:hypothetical protein
MNSLQHSTIFFCRYAISQNFHIIDKASPLSWEGRRIPGFDKVSIVEEEVNW